MIRRAFRQLLNAEGRRAWALALLSGAGMTMTLYAIAALILVRTNVTYVLYLGLAAHVAIFVVITGFAGLIVKRTLTARIAGNELSASDLPDPASKAAVETATAAVEKAAQIAQDAKP
jgi:hypothetical protein